ncbi:3-oxoacyl-ACP synthase [Actinophytocola xinjiangensis]|uniref:3-oxoacyl-ACP synthase n=1 Tax=Actinophytocola xinjiangensis TaxID=485602 RepID=A0A7Z1AVG1_9PSEU|nr:beta-ketoacyl-ACP synthase 3 [Actinophytocola xinjiangensis]OLF05265.1 3-oxoacyl-ACP synthase [Actinophytocola xinjiangensis]
MTAAVLAGIGACLPATAVPNEELVSWWADRPGTTSVDAGWISSRTGIRSRHVVAPGEATSDLAVTAGRRALDSAGVRAAGTVVLATNTPDRLSPATAPDVAARLDLGPVGAFDVGAVCTGFVYALATAAGLIAARITDSVLVIGADAFTTVLDPDDLTTRAVFGDGAGAVLLRAGTAGEPGALGGFLLGSDGADRELIEIPGGGSRQRSTGLPVKEEDTYFRMRGRPVFARAVTRMSGAVRHTAEDLGWGVAGVDRFVLHQANARILAAVARGLRVPADRFVSNIAEVGNTVAASVPLAMAAGAATGRLRPGDRVVLAGFGGGLTWGSAALVWPDLPLPSYDTPDQGGRT